MAGGVQVPDLLVALADGGGQGVVFGLAPCRGSGGVFGGLAQASAVPGGGLLGVLAQVVPPVPAVGDLERAGGAAGGAV